MRDTPYATELVSVEQGHARIERLHIKDSDQDAIRFSYWRDGKMTPRPLDLREDELLPLMRDAIKQGVFTAEFLDALKAALSEA